MGYWTMWGAALYGANRLLVFSPNEYVHYPLIHGF